MLMLVFLLLSFPPACCLPETCADFLKACKAWRKCGVCWQSWNFLAFLQRQNFPVTAPQHQIYNIPWVGSLISKSLFCGEEERRRQVFFPFFSFCQRRLRLSFKIIGIVRTAVRPIMTKKPSCRPMLALWSTRRSNTTPLLKRRKK